MWNLIYDADELICLTETGSQTQRKDVVAKENGGREGWIGSLGLADTRHQV